MCSPTTIAWFAPIAARQAHSMPTIQVTKRVYRSPNGGQTWAEMQVSALSLLGNYAKLSSVPKLGSTTDTTGHLFFTGGDASSIPISRPCAQPLYRSTNGGGLWTEVPNVKEALAVGYGKNDQSSAYPAIGFYGWYNELLGDERQLHDVPQGR
jgi:hypothetical protein